MHNAGEQTGPARQNGMESAIQAPERRRSRRDKKRKSSRDSKKLQRDPEKQRNYSFSPGRNDDIRVGRNENQPPVPPLPAQIKGKPLRANTEKQETVPAVGPVRAKTQPLEAIEDWQRMPTLHKRSGQEMARRKSSKKQRKEEHAREKEIKAMVAFMPVRPAAEPNSSGRPMKRESRKARGGLNLNFANPSSDVSLPKTSSKMSSTIHTIQFGGPFYKPPNGPMVLGEAPSKHTFTYHSIFNTRELTRTYTSSLPIIRLTLHWLDIHR